ncbi:tol-pal system protein YbgF [Desulfolutivibrio sulfodismutans]|nr:tol-pal system protein YbgF [Desulfolutivibrio sulfodismutans]
MVLSFAGCRTTGPIAQSSTDFRLQNIEAALVKIQGEVQALESKQAAGDKNWGEVRAKLDELALLLRSRTGEAGAASVQDAPPPWAGQPMAANQAAASKATTGPGEKNAVPYAPPGKSAAQNGKGQPAPPSDVGRPFPAVPPGQTAQAVQAAASVEPTPPPAQKNQEPAPQSPAAELAAAGLSAPAPVSAATPGGNPAKAWELPGPGESSAKAQAAAVEPAPAAVTPAAPSAPPAMPPASSLSPYPAVLPPVGEGAAQTPIPPAAATPVATAVQAAAPAPGRAPTPYAAPSGPAPSAAPAAPAAVAPASGKPSPGEEADYNRALKLALNGKPREASAAFGEFLTRHPHSPLEPNVRYWIGESDYNQGNFSQAAQSFTDVSTRYPGHHKAADSLYKLGMVQEKLGNTAAARTAYESLIKDYPASELTGNAKRKLEQLPR